MTTTPEALPASSAMAPSFTQAIPPPSPLAPFPASVSSSLVTNTVGEEVSTLFIVGFPEDMQEREFQNMFIFSPGFEAATLKVPAKDMEEDVNYQAKKQTIGFAKFRTRSEALEARDVLNGRKVDAEKGSLLKAEMAKKNLHTKRGLSNELQVIVPLTPKRFLPSSQTAFEAFYSVPINVIWPDPSLVIGSTVIPLIPQPPLFKTHRASFRPPMPDTPNRFAIKASRFNLGNIADQNPPCNTLYVGNLPANTDEEELKAMFASCTGYKRLSFRNKPQGPMCFVEFEQVVYATNALQTLHGNTLSNSVKGGIRLSYSKNPLGVRQQGQMSPTAIVQPRPSLPFDPQLASHLANSHA
ncbi:hypothetical protein PHYBLDRAFT_131156 [Phycomyces blakesleeanus NRRL 1555(-)]|uniref:RRM domain-containing protein n=1 Tax=Phycomyces blakesleeanus (strain ATCC 8743b / DSM 1359 / FGSC 10004 / NBRC 33097 / NRRL 1555) TaxID=763407 RepID=A0A162XZS6_PHYB8|nr:hypothetical protein PHYBLDRAFT_131156 [Phycomyces blakesleeanus NRRL 1555(-)]OAD77475.1 hypothetical protein PHYBLDRAFT_131156 [Phycomyces blakesleeanus NRRL 1555(-)]|eukprot:XP_018295515.1 hypothetical protein PHYBLDRAFT_131156 [Phycomyces blakesleeanus NRRL 1555(-)]